MELAKIEDGFIVIRVAIGVLCGPAISVIEAHFQQTVDASTFDAQEFAKDLCEELNSEDDIGDTPITRLIEKACISLIENGGFA